MARKKSRFWSKYLKLIIIITAVLSIPNILKLSLDVLLRIGNIIIIFVIVSFLFWVYDIVKEGKIKGR